MVVASPTSITVTDTQSGLNPAPDPKAVAASTAQTATVTASATPLTESTGVERSAVYRINADNTVETLWSSKEENAYDLGRRCPCG